ncbi:DEAD/DEAH box helicase family protein [Leuconostoc falkenbergense]|uniref:DEAD/DEAH box helicase family protein n=1 Tax=Leuconostoc falkenbergense TaxID=2766470 RepID=A0ABT7S072_9LACO|nr:DEAD/DEAH box helicase family protein [Leuconostoc falkenbergense]MDM7646958.1 DEAD/DEAH box helicase family protein [Leuconostoc falkenbergense]
MSYQLFPFQENAVNILMDKFFRSTKKTSLLYAPTGSGKTVMMIALMDRIIKNNPNPYEYTFVWLTPGNGELEEQSWRSASTKAVELKSQLLPDALLQGFLPGVATFINWELIKSKKNNAVRDGETKNLDDIIKNAQEAGIHFVLIIDEEHRDQTNKAQDIIEKFNADKIIRVSATPRTNGPDYDVITINDEDAIAAGLITRQIVLNDNVHDDESISDTVPFFLDLADEKRRSIKLAYQAIGVKLNPLVLIQFPDEKKSNKIERDFLINKVDQYLVDGLGQHKDGDNPTISRWLSNEHINTEQLEQQNNPINYLMMKQAVSTGWDAPRAKILIKFRMNTEATFTLQTIGRIRRMPEQKHYDNRLLDSGFIYSDDQDYLADIMNSKGGHKLVTYELNPEAPNFGLASIKPNASAGITNEEVVKYFYGQLSTKYKLTNDVDENKNTLKLSGYIFGTEINQQISISDDFVNDTMSKSLGTRNVKIPVNSDIHRLRLLDAEQDIMKPFHVDKPADAYDILVELFSIRAAGVVIPPILKMKNLELMAFIINNRKKIRDDAREMDSGKFAKQLNLFNEVNEGRADVVPFILPTVDAYAMTELDKYDLLTKNVYVGYSTKNWVKQSEPERDFERWAQASESVKWIYRSKDRGEQYFSIAYGAKKEGFYPDYILQGVDGITYIIETKGGQSADGVDENIDPYAEQKFNALRNYAGSEWGENIKFAFVRKDKRLNRLKFNNSQWSNDVSANPAWRPLEELFTFFSE